MSATQLEVIHGENFSGSHIGTLGDLDHYLFFHPQGKGRGYPGKLFLKEALTLNSMEVSINKLGVGQGMPFNHTHTAHEELYIFLKGRGQFQVDGTVIDVQEGSVIRVSPQGVRTWRNHSQEDLYYIVIQALEGSMVEGTIEDGVRCEEPPHWPD